MQKKHLLCPDWSEGHCKHGNRCHFAHGKTQMRRSERARETEEHDELREALASWGGQAPGPNAPPKLLDWYGQLSCLPHGCEISFTGLSPAERLAIHQVADCLHLEHRSEGGGERRKIIVRRPSVSEAPTSAQASAQQRWASQPVAPAEVYNILKVLVCFSELCREKNASKKQMEASIQKASRDAYKVLTQADGEAAIINELEKLKVQHVDLRPGNRLGRDLARELFDRTRGDRCPEEDVIDNVFYSEPPAAHFVQVPEVSSPIISAGESRNWEHAGQPGDGSIDEESLQEDVHLLRYGGGDTESFRAVLLHGAQLSECRDAMKIADCTCVLPEGALIFVKPEQYSDVCRTLRGLMLHPFHIVISQSVEPCLQKALATLPYRRRPKEKLNNRQALDLSTVAVNTDCAQLPAAIVVQETCAEGNDDLMLMFCTSRTFLCLAPVRADAATVVQSTTEAVAESDSHYCHFRGENPRRFV